MITKETHSESEGKGAVSAGVQRLAFAVLLMVCPMPGPGATYYADADGGNDANDGMSASRAWKTLTGAGKVSLLGGDQILLKRGDKFTQQLAIHAAEGTSQNPVIVDAYGTTGGKPIIAPSGSTAIKIQSSNYLEIRNLELVGGGVEAPFVADSKRPVYRHLVLKDLYIHDVYQGTGCAVFINNAKGKAGSIYSEVTVEQCRIERVRITGIRLGDARTVHILSNQIKDLGFCGIIVTGSTDVVVRGNVVDRPGCRDDQRMTMKKGDGGYVMGCKNVLVEKNTFMRAVDTHADGCGFHVDVNNMNFVYQRNLSVNNNGGFVQVLGGNRQCAFRYNISVNDGWRSRDDRVKQAEGKCIFLTGWTVNKGYIGPTNCYIYNNTVYVAPELPSTFHVGKTLHGVLIANNIFHVLGKVTDSTKANWGNPGDAVANVLFANNLYSRAGLIPSTLSIKDADPMVGDAEFANPGGTNAADYVPAAGPLVQDKGIPIEHLPGDKEGIPGGLVMTADFFGSPIRGLPDLGAVELPAVRALEGTR